MPTPSGSDVKQRLQQRLESTWAAHAIAGANNVSVTAATHGRWRSRSGCSSPALWIFLVGHHRTFTWTQQNLAKVASLSSDSCAFVAAFMPDEVEAPLRETTPGVMQRGQRDRTDVRGLTDALKRVAGADGDASVASLLHHAARTTFAQSDAPSFAYAVIRRTGLVARYPACLSLYWHGVWVLASLAASAHGIRPDDTAVVVRTRPDVMLTQPMVITNLRNYFRHGVHGRHMALGQAVQRASGSNDAQGKPRAEVQTLD